MDEKCIVRIIACQMMFVFAQQRSRTPLLPSLPLYFHYIFRITIDVSIVTNGTFRQRQTFVAKNYQRWWHDADDRVGHRVLLEG